MTLRGIVDLFVLPVRTRVLGEDVDPPDQDIADAGADVTSTTTTTSSFTSADSTTISTSISLAATNSGQISDRNSDSSKNNGVRTSFRPKGAGPQVTSVRDLFRSHHGNSSTTASLPAHSPVLDRLFALPPELQLLILSYLDFGDIERLRRTCRTMRAHVSKPVIRALFPDLEGALLGTCYLCLRSDNSRQTLIRSDRSDARYPLASRCFGCIAQRGEFMVGRKYVLGNDADAWVCRWCGYPVASGAAWNQPEFHKRCYSSYNVVLIMYFFCGCVQWVIFLVGEALCWAYFKHDILVLAPTVVNCFMTLWSMLLSLVRGPAIRTYHWALLMECGILALWAVPFYAILRPLVKSHERPPKSTVAALEFIIFNMFCRILNIIGYLVLAFEYKFWKRNKPRVPPAKRFLNRCIGTLLVWTYPQSVEQDYPPKWWFSRRLEVPHVHDMDPEFNLDFNPDLSPDLVREVDDDFNHDI